MTLKSHLFYLICINYFLSSFITSLIAPKLPKADVASNGMNTLFAGLMDNIDSEVIETEGEVVEDCEECALPDPTDEEE